MIHSNHNMLFYKFKYLLCVKFSHNIDLSNVDEHLAIRNRKGTIVTFSTVIF